ncbi:helicase associated domain-containing protein [Streptomyces sp. NPDC050095]|uniref:helicase associated domain-containing protein n=1 Tax=unclassified Streptomyces TaxID=2593676 RepID=UPI003421F7A0
MSVNRAGTLEAERIDEIDPDWRPAWDIAWQRALRLVQIHVQAGGIVPTAAGELPAQQELLTGGLRLLPAAADERPVRRTQDHEWELNLAAAKQFHTREGHLNVPRKHIEHLPVVDAGPAATGRETTPEGTVPTARLSRPAHVMHYHVRRSA